MDEEDIDLERIYIIDLPEILHESKLSNSKSEARRLIDQGAVRINQNYKVEPKEYQVFVYCPELSFILSVGTRKYKRIIFIKGTNNES